MNLLINAITTQTAVAFMYSDKPRRAEIHAVGINKDGKTMVRAWASTISADEPTEGWRLFDADKMTELTATEHVSLAPRPGFKMGDSAMTNIIAEIVV